MDKQLQQHIQRLQQQAEAQRQREITRVVHEIRGTMDEYGITAKDLRFMEAPVQRWRTPPAPKYRTPATGQTWSGRGRALAWIAGKDMEPFRIRCR